MLFPMVQSNPSFEIPLILDEPYDLAETAALRYGVESDDGLLAGTDLPATLFSMSGYGKVQPDSFHGECMRWGAVSMTRRRSRVVVA